LLVRHGPAVEAFICGRGDDESRGCGGFEERCVSSGVAARAGAEQDDPVRLASGNHDHGFDLIGFSVTAV
jgi:hypothetical protein